ncbi:MAG: M16 family metallopeptidase [Vicinamibacterales bacterium]
MTRRLGGAGVIAGLVLGASVAASAPQWPKSAFPPPLPAHAVSFPPYQMRTLPNGLQVVVVLHHEEPSVSFRLLIRAGAMQEPADKPGVASFVAALLNQGTTSKSGGEIAAAIDAAGGSVGVGSGNELSFINGAVIKDQVDLVLGLVAEMIEHPAFSPEEIDRQRRQILSSLQVSYDDPDYLADLVFDRLVFGFHPYGRPNDGTPESVARITRDDLVTFERTWFVPNNALLAVVGDLSSDEAFAAVDRAFGKWARRDVPAVRPVDPPPPTRRVIVVDRPGSAQTEIRVGHLAVPRTHPDYLPFDLAVRILGGEGANRLFGVLRTDRGLTYGASADVRAYKNAGLIVAQTDTRSPATAQALRLLVDEYARLQREPVDSRELRGAQDFMSGNFPLTIETPSAIAEQVLGRLFYGQDPKELETYRDRVDRVTVGDISRVTRELLKPDQLSIVLVGDAAAFVDDLKALGFGDFERIPLAQLDLNSPTLKRKNTPGVFLRKP